MLVGETQKFIWVTQRFVMGTHIISQWKTKVFCSKGNFLGVTPTFLGEIKRTQKLVGVMQKFLGGVQVFLKETQMFAGETNKSFSL